MTEIDKLVEALLNDPNSLTEDDLNKLAKDPTINRYSIVNNNLHKTNDKGEKVTKHAFFSYSNLQEDYMSRVDMTSMVGFIYKMYKEYEIEPKNRLFRDEKRVSEKGLDKTTTGCYDVPKLEGMAQKIMGISKEIKAVEDTIERIKYKFLSLEIEDKEIPKEDKDYLERVEKSRLAMIYAVTQQLVEYGEDANRRIHNILELCTPHQDVMSEIDKIGFKLPPSPEDVVIPEDFAKGLIKTFLDKYFEYDPDEHVRSVLDNKLEITGGDYEQHDPSRPTMKLLKAAANNPDLSDIYGDRETYNACMHLLHRPKLLDRLYNNKESLKTELTKVNNAVELIEHIPPADTFHRWSYYKEVNMEEIRNVVHAIYHEKPLLDFMVNVYDVIEGTDAELEQQRKDFAAKYNEELCSDLNVAQVGKWTFLGNFKKNRENIDFYNRHTEVLKRIMEQHEQDKKLGGDLMRKRVKKAKTKNIQEDGKDAAILTEYKKQVQDLATMGATRGLNADEKRAIEDAKRSIKDVEEVADVPENAIKVNVFKHDTKEGTMVKDFIYTQSENPPTVDQIKKTLEDNKRGAISKPDNLS